MDYQVEISGPDGKWTRTFSEWSSAGSNRTLSEKDGVKDFFAKNGRYVLLSADLNAEGLTLPFQSSFGLSGLIQALCHHYSFRSYVDKST